MAHNIATINGKSAIAYVGDTPWHRLGTDVTGQALNLEQLFTAAGLDWDVVATPAFSYFVPADTSAAAIETSLPVQAIHRATDGKLLGTVGARYTPIQHREFFRIFQPSIDAGLLSVEVLGALGDGETVWLLMKLPQQAPAVVRTLRDGRPDVVLPYVLASTGHIGNRHAEVKPTATRVVCNNTLDVADRTGQVAFSIRHTASAAEQLDAVRESIAHATEAFAHSVEIYRQFAQCKLTETQLLDYITAVLPTPAQPRRVPTFQNLPVDESRAIVAELLGSTGLGTLESAGAELVHLATINARDAARAERWSKETERIKAEQELVLTLARSGFGNDGSSVWDAYNGVTEFIDHTARRDTGFARESAAKHAIDGDGSTIKARAFNMACALAG